MKPRLPSLPKEPTIFIRGTILQKQTFLSSNLPKFPYNFPFGKIRSEERNPNLFGKVSHLFHYFSVFL